jgi:diacylglycerol kinase (ATP)
MTCVIFNPTARGDKARRFRSRLAELGPGIQLIPTAGPDTAPGQAATAVEAGCTTLVAAGGDGTVNQVLNGLVTARDGLAKARLGVLPLGTVNVFAKELGIPTDLAGAWRVVQVGHEQLIDLPMAESGPEGRRERRCFAQMAGAGLDSRALGLVDWELKKKFGVLAYVWASLLAMRGPRPVVTIEADGRTVTGHLVCVGNGRFLGGRYPVFPHASMDDGKLDAMVVPKMTWTVALKVFAALWFDRFADSPDAVHLAARTLTMTSATPMPFHLEGDNVGALPATFTLRPRALRVVVPG